MALPPKTGLVVCTGDRNRAALNVHIMLSKLELSQGSISGGESSGSWVPWRREPGAQVPFSSQWVYWGDFPPQPVIADTAVGSDVFYARIFLRYPLCWRPACPGLTWQRLKWSRNRYFQYRGALFYPPRSHLDSSTSPARLRNQVTLQFMLLQQTRQRIRRFRQQKWTNLGIPDARALLLPNSVSDCQHNMDQRMIMIVLY